jgi:hypothetical protein
MTERLLKSVRSKYGAVADSTLSSRDAGVKAVAEAFGYSTEELTSIPAEANMGLSCGNPTAIASIRSGEVVADLGSGGGMDVFLASPLVGPEEVERAFRDTFSILDRRISLFLSLPLSTLDQLALQKEINNIGRQ